MFDNLLATLIGLLSLLGLVPADDAATPSDPAEPAAAELQLPDPSAIDADAASTELATVGDVDAEQYAGLWYELARLPVRFQDPASVSTAEYEVRGDGTIAVTNTAYLGEEESYQLEGSAEPVAAGVSDRYVVSFDGFLSFVPTPDEGNYWVMELADDYSMALVGTPDREFLWLLARDGTDFDEERAAKYLERAAADGFDTTELAVADWQTRLIRS